MQPLTILVIVANAIVGGMETSVLRLVSSLARDAFRIVALVPVEGRFADELRAAGAVVHTAPLPADPSWRSIQLAAGLVRDCQVDVIHAHMAPAHQLAGIVGRIARVPVVATVHAMHVSMADLETHFLAGTHLCLVSEAARAHALAIGAVPARLRVVTNAVDAARFAPAGGARDAPLAIGFAGRLSPEKHPLLFVSIAARVAERCPDATFVVAGDGPLRRAMEQAAAELGIADRFSFLGIVSSMPEFYRRVDIVVATSRHEGTPLALLEAMACARPVVATAAGGVPEVVVDQLTGHLFPAGDAMLGAEAVIGLVLDASRREALGRAARQRVLDRFGWDAHVAAITTMWREIASERLAGPAKRRAPARQAAELLAAPLRSA